MASIKQKNKQQATTNVSLSWTDHAWEEFVSWRTENPKIAERIITLINACKSAPFHGIGKPEPLVGDLTGFWSRRITEKDRLVYLYEEGVLYIVMCKYHYRK